MTLQKDNDWIDAKLAVRRTILDDLGAESLSVLDLYGGTGLMWSTLRSEYTVSRYVPVDIKPKQRGTLIMTAAQASRTLDLSQFNVIDLDAYGGPWMPLMTVAGRLTRPTAIFITWGQVRSTIQNWMLAYHRLPRWKVPNAAGTQQADITGAFPSLSRALGWRTLHDLPRFIEIARAVHIQKPGQQVSYIGLLASPRTE
jgi:hypothetical protein